VRAIARVLAELVDWVAVPAGEVLMGTREEDVDAVLARHADLPVERSWFLKECPRHAVHVPDFAIARTPVTAGQLRLAAGALGLGEPAGIHRRSAAMSWGARTRWIPPPAGVADHPAAVSHGLAERFCRWMSEETGEAICLASEAQWERAARGGDVREYPWGDEFGPGRANIDRYSAGGTVPVGSFPAGASPFGVLDMAGNLDEWTSSTYAPYPGAPAAVPAVEDWSLDQHVTRGGGWDHGRDAARCARRHGLYSPGPVGFRLVRAV
jgi:formylglycine-generating enzyme required for sulfatase activity